MTPRERLLTALRRQIPDRVPMPLRMPKFMRKHRPEIMNGLEMNLAAREEFGIDIWQDHLGPILPCYSPETFWREDVTVEMRHEIRNGRNIWERTIHTPEGDLHDVKQALIVSDGSGEGPEIVEPLVKDLNRDIPPLQYMHMDPRKLDVENALRIEQQLGDRGLGIVNLYSPIDCREVMNQEDFLALYHEDNGAFRAIVDVGAKAMMAETIRGLEAGFKVFRTWWFYTSPSAGWSPRIYEEIFLPYLVRHVELIHQHGGTYIYYDDGKLTQFMDFYVDSGVDCVMTLTPPPMGDADPKVIKEKYGGRICLMGGIDVVNEVCRSTPQAIHRTVKERMEVYKTGGGYIFDGSNSIPYETPEKNVRALAEAGREFGGY